MQPCTGQAAWQIEHAYAPKQRSGSITAIVRGAFLRGPDIRLVHIWANYTYNDRNYEIRDNEDMDAEAKALLAEFVEKVALLRRDMQHKSELEKYAARFARMEQKLAALADQVERSDPDLGKALRTAWARPAMSLAYRNAAHQKED
jgi:hypothetical protein